MVADYITVTSKKAGEDKSYTWHSDGLGEYTVSDTDREFTRGTEVVVHIKETEDSFLDHFRLKNIVKTYSDHIAVAIYFIDGSDDNETQLNSSSALWTRPKTEITKEQYQEFKKMLTVKMLVFILIYLEIFLQFSYSSVRQHNSPYIVYFFQ